MPCFQTKHLLELQWASARDVVLVGCGHDPAGAQAVMRKLKQFEVLKSYTWSPLVPVVQARARRKHNVEYMHVARRWPKVPVHGVSALFRAFKEGLPKYQVAAQAFW